MSHRDTIVDQASTQGEAPWQSVRVIDAVRRRIVRDLKAYGREGAVTSIRFLPSTVVTRPDGRIEMIANTTIQNPDRPQVIESVVTLKRERLESVHTHEFERLTNADG